MYFSLKKFNLCLLDINIFKGVAGGDLNYLCAHIHLRFRCAHNKTKALLPSLGSWGGIFLKIFCVVLYLVSKLTNMINCWD